MTVPMTPFLKTTLRLDAVISGAASLLMVAGAQMLGPFLGLPVPRLFWAGVMLFPLWRCLLCWQGARTLRASCFSISCC